MSVAVGLLDTSAATVVRCRIPATRLGGPHGDAPAGDNDRRDVAEETEPGYTGEAGEDSYLLAQVRESFGRVVYSHKTREKQADSCFTKHRWQRPGLRLRRIGRRSPNTAFRRRALDALDDVGAHCRIANDNHCR